MRIATALALALLLAGTASAQQVAVFVDGRVLPIERTELLDETSIRLHLGGGGSIEVPLTRLDRVVEDAAPPAGDEPVAVLAACLAAWQDQALPEGTAFANEIARAAQAADLHPWLVAAVVEAESRSNPRAVSRVGARGLMQLMPAVWTEQRVRDPHDPVANLDAGCRHLRRLLDRFGDLRLALAAYNAGPATVLQYNGIPPYRETQRYVTRVLGRFCPAEDLTVAAAR